MQGKLPGASLLANDWLLQYLRGIMKVMCQREHGLYISICLNSVCPFMEPRMRARIGTPPCCVACCFATRLRRESLRIVPWEADEV